MQNTQINITELMKKLILTCLPVLMLFGSINAQNMNFKNDDYASEWSEIQKLEEQGLPKSAREKVDALYIKAKSDNNPSQVIKTLIFRSKYISQLEEDGFVMAVSQMQDEARRETFPTKAVLQSMLGELYAGYLENNVWRFRNRTTTVNFKQDDLRTWDIEKLNAEAASLYRESLNYNQLNQIPITNLKAVITDGSDETDKIRPTLYDFLAHRAIDFFMNEKTYLAQPAYKFELDNEGVFKDADNFVAQLIDSKDSTSGKLWTLKLLQELTRTHIKDADPTALIDLDLKRLEFGRENSILDNKDELYVKSLESLQRKYTNNPAFVEISLKLANYYYEKAQTYKRNPENIGKNHYKTALELCKTAVQRFPQAYGVKGCRNLVNNITESALSVNVEQVNVATKPILTKLDFRNIDSVYFKIVKANETILNKPYESAQERLAYLNSLPFIKNWGIKVLNEGDYNASSTETKIDKLPLGNYLVICSDNERFQLTNGGRVNYTHFYVSNIAYMQRTDDGSKEIIVTDRTTGAPIKGVKVEFWSSKYNSQTSKNEVKKELTALSDVKGFVRPKLAENAYYSMKFIFGKDTLNTGDAFSFRIIVVIY